VPRRGVFLFLIAAAAVLVTAAPSVFAGGRPDSSAARLAPWNAPNPFCRKNCGATATCTSPPRDQRKAATAPRAPGRWSR